MTQVEQVKNGFGKKVNARVRTGISGLDKMLFGGFVKGRNILLSGPAGSGKTTLAMQYAYHGAMSGEKSLYVALEQQKERIVEDMAKFGFDILAAEKNNNLFLMGGPISKISSSIRNNHTFVGSFLQDIVQLIKKEKIDRVVIDSINLYTMLFESEKEKRAALTKITNTLSALNCTTLLTSETEEGTMKISNHGIEEFVVDHVIVLYLMREGSHFVPGIAVRKMRGSDHDREIRVFKIGDSGVNVYHKEMMFGNM